MNTKGIKFLAVLTVMVMAFAAIVALAPADKDNDAIIVYGDDSEAATGITEITTSIVKKTQIDGGNIYVADDATIKVKAANDDVVIYVQNGKEVSVDFKDDCAKQFTIVTVTGDQQADVYLSDSEEDLNHGKIILDGTHGTIDTSVTFKGVKGQSVYYKAAIVNLDFHYDYTTSAIKVSAGQFYKISNAMIGTDKAFGAAITTGTSVAVAAGQSIEITGNVNVANMIYGAKIYTDGTTTYYGAGDDLGTVKLYSGDSALVKSASATFTYGTNTVKMAKVKDADRSGTLLAGTTVSPSSTGFSITGSMSAGSTTVSGVAAFNLTIGTSAAVTITNKTVVTGSIVDNGTLTLKTKFVDDVTITGDGKVIVQNKDLWNTSHNAISCLSQFTGLVDTYAITKVLEIKDDISRATIYPDQTFRVINSVNVFTSLEVQGILIIDEGVTLTIEEGVLFSTAASGADYVQIINNGTIIVKNKDPLPANFGMQLAGGYIENNGDIIFQAKNNITVEGTYWNTIASTVYKFINNGKMSVSSKDAIALEGAVNNSATGTIDINGILVDTSTGTGTSFTNNGIVTLGGNATSTGNVRVDLGPGAILKISAVKINGTNTIGVYRGDANSVVIGATGITGDEEYATIRNLVFTGDYTSSLSNAVNVMGTMTVSIPGTSAEKKATITMSGNIEVSDALSIPNHTELILGADVFLNVEGLMTVSDEVVYSPSGNGLRATVSGAITTLKYDKLSGIIYNGAKYTLTDGTTIFTNLADAIAEADALGLTSVLVGNYGYTYITENLTIPGEMSLDPDGIGSALVIGKDSAPAVVTVEQSAAINMYTTVVNGALYAEDKSDVFEDDVFSHVMVEGEKDVTYASLNFAIDNSLSNELVLVNDFEMDGANLVIPAGVTVDAINKDKKFICIDSNLTVNGLLIVDEFYFVAETNDDLVIDINGTIMEETSGAYIDGKWFTPEGVSYTATLIYDEEETIFFVITDISNLQSAIDNADDAKVTIEGSPAIGDVTVRGPNGEVAEITFSEDIKAGTITMENVIIKASDGAKINATFANAKGSIVITGAYVVDNKEFTISVIDDGVVTMSGPITDVTDATYSITFYGETGMDDGIIGWGQYNLDGPAVYPAITFVGDTVATGKKNAIVNNTYLDVPKLEYGIVTIAGSLTASNGAKITIGADVDVLGALVAAEKDGAGVGVVDVEGNIFIGITQAELWDPSVEYKAVGKYNEEFGGPVVATSVTSTGASASVTGKVNLDDNTKIVVAYGSYVAPEIVEDIDYFDLTIDGEEWLTIYGKKTFYLDGILVPVYDCDIESIYDQDMNIVSGFNNDYRVLCNSEAITFGVTEWINIGVKYDVFTVKIKTDGSVKAIYIDGILMETGENKNIFYRYGVETGVHEVSVEAATGYDAKKCVLKTDLGTLLPGLGFAFSEDDCEIIDGINTHRVVYNLYGTEIQPEPVPPTPEEESQWTITTILLVILVVLIAIMAVIVALRLNRS